MGGSGLLLGWRDLVVWVGMLFVYWDVCVGGTGVFVVVAAGVVRCMWLFRWLRLL